MITRFFPVLTKLKALKTHGRMLWHAFKHADTPKWIKGFMIGVVAYLFVPIDIIPDFLVFFGITDDLIVISAAMWFLGKVVPENVKNSLPNPEQPKQATASAGKSTPATVAKSALKPFAWILVIGLVIAALLNKPWIYAQLSSIGALF